jgi:hypothetical protein
MQLSIRLVIEALFLLGSQALFFTLAWAFLIQGLVQDYASNSSDQEFLLSTFPTNTYRRKQKWWQGGMLVQVVFALTLTWSCQLFELIILEILDLLGQEYDETHVMGALKIGDRNTLKSNTISNSVRSRWYFWRLTLDAMLLLVIAIIPYYQCALVIRNTGNSDVIWGGKSG